ncbi:hypothetical protein BSKO_07240 [Bryopsis sp. KO-2023]|nr:hypothetical protein BSKO_07240 [Bryopsis sp. KO-2023]
MSNPTLNLIFEKLSSDDKDYRYMATSDLLQELKKETIRLDAETERKICRVVLQQMQDISGDISNLAVKCLGALVPKIQEGQVGEVSNNLCDKVLSEKKEDIEKRDMASIGLKTVIAEITSGTAGQVIVKTIAPKLIQGLHSKESEVVIESLDIIREMVARFGHLMEGIADELQGALTPKLEDTERSAIRKRAIQCIGVLAIHLSDVPLDALSDFLVTGAAINSRSTSIKSTYIQAIGCVSRSVGYRFGKHLPKAVPLVIEKISEADEEDGELMEMGLHALESFVSRCPAQVKVFIEKIMETALVYLKHDPNFAADLDDIEDDEMDYEEEEDDDFSDEYTDDDDESWKVRRAAAHCLSAIFINNPDQISVLYPKAAPDLLKRFAEREENVRVDVFNAYVDLLRQVSRVSKHLGEEHQQRILGGDMDLLMKALSKQLKEKSMKIRIGAFVVLRELAHVMPKSLSKYISLFVDGIKRAFTDKSSQSDLKIEALSFLKMAMCESEPATFQAHLPDLSEPVFASVQERYYKVTAEALRVCREMVRIIRPEVGGPIPDDLKPMVVALFDATMARLGAQDQDQEVKECAIKCVAVAVKQLGDILPEKVQAILQILLERARSETTRLTTVKALNTIAKSELDIDLSPILEPSVVQLTDFLRKANMVLRQASLAALGSLSARLGHKLSSEVIQRMITEASVLIDDKDLHLTAQSLTLLKTLLDVQPGCASEVADKGIPRAMALVNSTLLQGGALEALRGFYAVVAKSNTPSGSFTVLFAALMEEGSSGGKVQQLSVAQCIASLCCDGQPQELPGTVAKLMEASEHDAGAKRLVLFVLGELGRRTDLSQYGDIESLLAASMTDKTEDIKAAGSFALGAITVGNLEKYLPSLLQKIKEDQSNPKRLYLLLQALNEVIRSMERMPGAVFSQGDHDSIVEILLMCSESEEECRNVVAECLGHMALIHPLTVFNVLSERITSESPNMRYTVITSVKYTILDKESPVDPVLHSVLPTYLGLIEDEDRHVRKAAVQVLCSVLTHKVPLIEEHLSDVLPMLYKQTVKRKDLIRVMDLGPFKLAVDDGLELRKAAFECMDLLLDACPKQLDTAQFTVRLLDGLADDSDIKLLCHPMLSKLCGMAETEVLVSLDKFVEPLQKTLTTDLKKDAVKQEKDRHEDMVRSCLRCVIALSQLPTAQSSTTFKRFMDTIVQKGEMKARFIELEKEKAELEGNTTGEMGRLVGGLLLNLNRSGSLGMAYS